MRNMRPLQIHLQFRTSKTASSYFKQSLPSPASHQQPQFLHLQMYQSHLPPLHPTLMMLQIPVISEFVGGSLPYVDQRFGTKSRQHSTTHGLPTQFQNAVRPVF